jgi:hypothetical protein
MNAPFKVQSQKLPDIYIDGDTVEKILMLLNNSIIFAKSNDGSMRPFIDPAPLINIINGAINAALVPVEGEKQ